MKVRELLLGAFALLFGVMASAQSPSSPKGLFPAQVGDWKLRGPQAFDDKTIFDYMDGAAEPYMTFSYKQMYMGQYAKGGKTLVVELYDMGSPVEAYGAFTLDVEGQPVEVGTEALLSESGLRVWKGPYFIKVADLAAGPMEPDAAKQIAAALVARVEAAGERPKLLAAIPATFKPTKTRYFHRDVTLSDIYYVSTKNVLELCAETEGIWAECQVESAKPKVAVIRYPSAELRDKAWAGLCGAVFTQPGAGKGAEPLYAEQIEPRASTGIRKLSGPDGEPLLALCFEARNVEQCTKTLQAIGGAEAGKGGK